MKTQDIAEWTTHEVELIVSSALRYTRFVRSTKVVLGLLVSLLISMLMFYSFTKNQEAGIRVAFTKMAKGVATPTAMINARYHGLDKNNQPFNLNAAKATQRDENTMDLVKVTSDITLQSGLWLSVSSDTGVFYSKQKLLDLAGNVDMFDDQGYEFRTAAMHVDLGEKTARSTVEVKGQGPLGTLRSSGAFAEGKKGLITYYGPVYVTLYPTKDPTAPAQKTAQPAREKKS